MLQFFKQYMLSGVLQFTWNYIDVVEKGVTFLVHPVEAETNQAEKHS